MSCLEPIINVGKNDLVVTLPSKLALYTSALASTVFLIATSPKKIVPAGDNKDLTILL